MKIEEIEVSFKMFVDPWGPSWVCCLVHTVNGKPSQCYGHCPEFEEGALWVALSGAISDIFYQLEE